MEAGHIRCLAHCDCHCAQVQATVTCAEHTRVETLQEAGLLSNTGVHRCPQICPPRVRTWLQWALRRLVQRRLLRQVWLRLSLPTLLDMTLAVAGFDKAP
jgi:hypothetical protein